MVTSVTGLSMSISEPGPDISTTLSGRLSLGHTCERSSWVNITCHRTKGLKLSMDESG